MKKKSHQKYAGKIWCNIRPFAETKNRWNWAGSAPYSGAHRGLRHLRKPPKQTCFHRRRPLHPRLWQVRPHFIHSQPLRVLTSRVLTNTKFLWGFTREKWLIQSDQSQACYERCRSVLVKNAVVPTSVIGQKKSVGNNDSPRSN